MTDKMQAPQAIAWGAWEVAGAEGLELSTSGFGDRRSSQLSYTPKYGWEGKHPSRANQGREGQTASAPKVF